MYSVWQWDGIPWCNWQPATGQDIPTGPPTEGNDCIQPFTNRRHRFWIPILHRPPFLLTANPYSLNLSNTTSVMLPQPFIILPLMKRRILPVTGMENWMSSPGAREEEKKSL